MRKDPTEPVNRLDAAIKQLTLARETLVVRDDPRVETIAALTAELRDLRADLCADQEE